MGWVNFSGKSSRSHSTICLIWNSEERRRRLVMPYSHPRTKVIGYSLHTSHIQLQGSRGRSAHILPAILVSLNVGLEACILALLQTLQMSLNALTANQRLPST